MILDTVKIALAKALNLKNGNHIQPDDRLKEDLGLDSMSSLTFLMALEESIERFVVDPDTLDVNYLETVASITKYIESQLKLLSTAEFVEKKYA